MSGPVEKNGRIYVLTNDDMPGLVKVGKTRGAASSRAAELSAHTGVPSHFRVYQEYHVNDCDAAERRAHQILERQVGRPSARREFFLGPADKVVKLLDDGLIGFIQTETQRYFDDAINYLRRKEFTLSCISFERNIKMSSSDINVLGAYLAACCAINREPLDINVLFHPLQKNRIMESAIEYVRAFDSEPEERIISFVRAYS